MKALLVCSLCALVAVNVSACSSSTGDEESEVKAHAGPLEIFPPHIWSGSDGTHTYKAPIIVINNPGKVTWTIDDPSIASIAPEGDDGENLMITALKPGTTAVHATSEGMTSTSDLNVLSYTAEEYAAGERRYTMGLDMANPPCKQCHAPGKGPDHTSTELDADPDEEIQNTFLTGVDPEGRPISENSEYASLLKGKTHMWMVTDTEKAGLLAYLRALPPMGFPEYDEPTTLK